MPARPVRASLPRVPLLAAMLAVALLAAGSPPPAEAAGRGKAHRAATAGHDEKPATATPANPDEPDIAGRSWIVVDVTTHTVLASKEADTRIEPASLTKLMTAYLAFNALKAGKLGPDMRPPVGETAYRAGGSRMFVDPKQPATVDELLHGLIIQSGNDAAVILAEAVGGSEAHFAELMNAEARRLGMTGTHFTNASGLPDGDHYSTARDMATLAMTIIQDHPNYYRLYSEKEFSYNGIRQPNRNRLLFSDSSVDGMKTGHTEAAGFCLVATAKREMPGTGLSRRVLTVLTGAASDNARALESTKLLNLGFQNFELVRLYKAGDAVGTARVWKGRDNELRTGFNRDVLVTVPRAAAASVKGEVERIDPLVAPIEAGQKVGVLRVRRGDQVIGQADVVALDADPEAGIVGRAWDTVRLWVQ